MSSSPSAAGLIGRSVSVSVPATTANLGAGFDALALALDLVNHVDMHVVAPGSEPDVVVDVSGEGASQLPTGRGNRFVSALSAGLAEAGLEAEGLGLRVRMVNGIPLSRGLGSSAAATVAGLVSADALLDGALGQQRILELAAGDEGHADNAAAALLGGLCVVAQLNGVPRAVRVEPPPGLLAALFVPDRHLATATMRAALPATVPFEDAVHNVAAAAMAVAALATGSLEMLSAATVDRLHEPYRAAAYPELPELVAAARAAGAQGACLSGAGSTVVAFSRDAVVAASLAAAMQRRATELGLSGRAVVHAARSQGAVCGPSATPARRGTGGLA